MAGTRHDSLVFYDEASRHSRRKSSGSGWAIVAVMAIGAILVLGNLVGLLFGSGMDAFGASSGDELAGAQIAGLVLGIGLVMRKDLARRVYLVFAIIGLVLTVLGSSSNTGSFASYIVGLGLDVVTVALLVHPSVKRAFN